MRSVRGKRGASIAWWLMEMDIVWCGLTRSVQGQPPPARYNHRMVAVNQSLYVFGGYGTNGTVTMVQQSFSIKTPNTLFRLQTVPLNPYPVPLRLRRLRRKWYGTDDTPPCSLRHERYLPM
jgi:hypothetical protein